MPSASLCHISTATKHNRQRHMKPFVFSFYFVKRAWTVLSNDSNTVLISCSVIQLYSASINKLNLSSTYVPQRLSQGSWDCVVIWENIFLTNTLLGTKILLLHMRFSLSFSDQSIGSSVKTTSNTSQSCLHLLCPPPCGLWKDCLSRFHIPAFGFWKIIRFSVISDH